MNYPPDQSPEMPHPNSSWDDAELEWLLCFASAFQSSQQIADNGLQLAWQQALRWFGAKRITQSRNQTAA